MFKLFSPTIQFIEKVIPYSSINRHKLFNLNNWPLNVFLKGARKFILLANIFFIKTIAKPEKKKNDNPKTLP